MFLAARNPLRQTEIMRALTVILVAALVLVGVYCFYLRKMPTADAGTAPTEAINLTGVRMDLFEIAPAEHSYIALNSRCASMDELISSNSLKMSRPERQGYTYTVDCSGAEFTATARHAPAPAASPIRYPVLAVDETMDVHEVN